MMRIEPFMTNTDRDVFGLKNMPEVVKGALFSRYSRSDKSLREILADEFLDAACADTASAEAFYDRVLLGFGDDSVAELGGAHIAAERISNLAALQLTDSRLGISFLEKSSRYVNFGQRDRNSNYPYYRDPAIMASAYAAEYVAAMDNLFDTYNALQAPVTAYIAEQYPKDSAITQSAYNRTVRAKVLDLLRGLLPLATLTNLGVYGNGRAYEYALIKLRSYDYAEYGVLADSMQRELDVVIPSFVKRAKSEKGLAYSQYLADVRQGVENVITGWDEMIPLRSIPAVHLVGRDLDAMTLVLSAILYEILRLPLHDAQVHSLNLSVDQQIELLKAYVGNRASRHMHVGRAFEATSYTFDIVADIGAYRDLHRHRVCSQQRQDFTCDLGFAVPDDIIAAGVGEQFIDALDQARIAFNRIRCILPRHANYYVPFAAKVRWSMQFNLREAYHMIELRSQPSGHSSYRKIVQEMYRQIKAVHPLLVAGMTFVDMQDYALGRLSVENRTDSKL